MPNTHAHTPGPWTTFVEHDRIVIAEPTWPDYGRIASVNISRKNARGEHDGQANAALIAAAPELLEAAYTALDTIRRLHGGSIINTTEQDRKDIATIKAAIARATQQGENKGVQ